MGCVMAGRGIASVGALDPGNPCSRMIRFEQIFNPDPAVRREFEITYADPDADVMTSCALTLSDRIDEEARRRGISRGELRKLWRDAESSGRTLFGGSGLDLLAALAPE